MLKSMTAFGRFRELTRDGKRDITAEIKSVNSRYFDCTVKIPRTFGFLEDKIKAYISDRGISRGKIDVYISVDIIESSGFDIELDLSSAESYIHALEKLRDEFSLKDDISVMSIAQNKDIFRMKRSDDDEAKDWDDIRTILSRAVDFFIESREREGASLETDIQGKLHRIAADTAKIKTLSEADITEYPTKLKNKIKQLLVDFDIDIAEQRILTEAAIFADKASVDEELVRLSSHFEAFEEILSSREEPAGRRLDFLLQEINREINTIASKSGNIEIARIVVNVKSELEKIREQVQNIE